MSQACQRARIDAKAKLRHAFVMLGNAIMNLHRAALLIILALALVATGLAHRAPSVTDQALALALANGARLDDFCANGLPGQPHSGSSCMACQITGNTDLPTPFGDLQKLELAVLGKVLAPRESRSAPRILKLAHGPQGPPVT